MALHRSVLPLFLGVLAGAVGPRFVSPQDRLAAEAFRYEPPLGFVDVAGRNGAAPLPPGTLGAWVYPVPSGDAMPNVNVTETPKRGGVEEADLARIVREMPLLFQASGSEWTHTRTETRERQDGRRVGLIEGAVTKAGVKTVALQLVFPTDKGTAIATASFPESRADTWRARFEETIEKAHGIAFRAPPPPGWMYVAFGTGAFALAFALLGALAARAKEGGKEAPSR